MIKKWLTRNYCECGNKKSCTGKNGFLVLYDVLDTGPFTAKFVLNTSRAAKCRNFHAINEEGKVNVLW